MTNAQNPLPGIPPVESPLFQEVLAQSNWDIETRRIGRDLHEKGYAVFDFPDSEFEQRATGIKGRLAKNFDLAQWREDGWKHGQGLRVQDAWRDDEDVRAIACNERVLQILSALYNRRAWPFQTLNFPVGTQQHYHSDSIHFSSVPERFMCGVWVALEDVPIEAGPLVYYPGSHKWPIIYNEMVGFCTADAADSMPTQDIYHDAWEGLVRATKSAPDYFAARKGQALIWTANLLHGGAKHENPQRTRWSQVTHYFFDDCAYITPMLSDPFLGRLEVRNLIDVSTGLPVENRYAGKPLTARFAEIGRRQVAAAASDQAPTMADDEQDASFALPADFDPARYESLHPDVKAAGIDPTEHFVSYGRREGRNYK